MHADHSTAHMYNHWRHIGLVTALIGSIFTFFVAYHTMSLVFTGLIPVLGLGLLAAMGTYADFMSFVKRTQDTLVVIFGVGIEENLLQKIKRQTAQGHVLKVQELFNETHPLQGFTQKQIEAPYRMTESINSIRKWPNRELLRRVLWFNVKRRVNQLFDGEPLALKQDFLDALGVKIQKQLKLDQAEREVTPKKEEPFTPLTKAELLQWLLSLLEDPTLNPYSETDKDSIKAKFQQLQRVNEVNEKVNALLEPPHQEEEKSLQLEKLLQIIHGLTEKQPLSPENQPQEKYEPLVKEIEKLIREGMYQYDIKTYHTKKRLIWLAFAIAVLSGIGFFVMGLAGAEVAFNELLNMSAPLGLQAALFIGSFVSGIFWASFIHWHLQEVIIKDKHKKWLEVIQSSDHQTWWSYFYNLLSLKKLKTRFRDDFLLVRCLKILSIYTVTVILSLPVILLTYVFSGASNILPPALKLPQLKQRFQAQPIVVRWVAILAIYCLVAIAWIPSLIFITLFSWMGDFQKEKHPANLSYGEKVRQVGRHLRKRILCLSIIGLMLFAMYTSSYAWFQETIDFFKNFIFSFLLIAIAFAFPYFIIMADGGSLSYKSLKSIYKDLAFKVKLLSSNLKTFFGIVFSRLYLSERVRAWKRYWDSYTLERHILRSMILIPTFLLIKLPITIVVYLFFEALRIFSFLCFIAHLITEAYLAVREGSSPPFQLVPATLIALINGFVDFLVDFSFVYSFIFGEVHDPEANPAEEEEEEEDHDHEGFLSEKRIRGYAREFWWWLVESRLGKIVQKGWKSLRASAFGNWLGWLLYKQELYPDPTQKPRSDNFSNGHGHSETELLLSLSVVAEPLVAAAPGPLGTAASSSL